MCDVKKEIDSEEDVDDSEDSNESENSDDSTYLYTDDEESDEYFEDDPDNDLDNSNDCQDDPGPSTSKRARKKQLPGSHDNDPRLWNRLEEMQFLNALKDFGTGHLEAICSRIPTKNSSQIKEYIERKRKYALSDLKVGMSPEDEVPIDKWITHLCKLMPDDDYKNQYVARVFKYIALFEEREPENESDVGVNLR